MQSSAYCRTKRQKSNDAVLNYLETKDQSTADEIVGFVRRQEEVTDFAGTSSERALAMVKANHKSEKGYKKAKLFDCKKCGRRHGPKVCPAYGAECHNCGGRNHLRTKNATRKRSMY